MTSRFASARHSIAECDRCGWRYKLTDLKPLTIKLKNTNILVCPECWEADQPQLQLGMYIEDVQDPQAVRNPRPDISYYAPGNNGAGGSRQIYWGWNPVGFNNTFAPGLRNPMEGIGSIGTATVVIS